MRPATSSANEIGGSGLTPTFVSSAASRRMTFVQPDPSTEAPWSSRTLTLLEAKVDLFQIDRIIRNHHGSLPPAGRGIVRMSVKRASGTNFRAIDCEFLADFLKSSKGNRPCSINPMTWSRNLGSVIENDR
jgi:hypothetical protein